MSFFSNMYGWGCDNVVNFELVTAAGTVINVNRSSEPDLFFALRGGGNNFGVVTRFDVVAYPQGQMWSGSLAYAWAAKGALVAGLVDISRRVVTDDPKAALWLSLVFSPELADWVVAAELSHADPQPDGAHPSIFDSLFRVPDPLSVSAGTKWQSEATAAVDAALPGGLRHFSWSITVVLDEALMGDLQDLFMSEMEDVAELPGAIPFCLLQAMSTTQLQKMGRDGGNALGMAHHPQPLLMVLGGAMWADARHDEAIRQALVRAMHKSRDLAKSRGLDHTYEYMNYASYLQDPVSSYGPASKARLLAIANKYDPEGIFQKLVPGGFKLQM